MNQAIFTFGFCASHCRSEKCTFSTGVSCWALLAGESVALSLSAAKGKWLESGEVAFELSLENANALSDGAMEGEGVPAGRTVCAVTEA